MTRLFTFLLGALIGLTFAIGVTIWGHPQPSTESFWVAFAASVIGLAFLLVRR